MQIQGPRSRELIRSLTDADLTSWYFRFLPEPMLVGGVPRVSRTGFSR